MKRGPAPNKGLGFAIPVALALGRVMFFVASPYYPGDFLIAGTGYFAVIRLHLAEKIGATIPEIQKDYYRSLAELASLPRGGPVCCELWLYSRYGRLRFFRVSNTGLEEIEHPTNIFKGREAGGAHTLAMLRSADQLPGRLAATGPGGTGPVKTGPAGSCGPGDPTTKFIRYLKRRNSIKKPVGREAKNAGSGRPLPIDDPVSYPGEISDAPPGTPEIPSPAEPVPPSPTENGAGS